MIPPSAASSAATVIFRSPASRRPAGTTQQSLIASFSPSFSEFDNGGPATRALKRTVMGHQVMLPITNGALDLGPWEQVFYAEFDGQRKKRVVVKVMGL